MNESTTEKPAEPVAAAAETPKSEATTPSTRRTRARGDRPGAAKPAAKPASAPKSTAKRSAGLHDAAERVSPVRPAPVERPYSEAITSEQRQAMKDHGLL